MSFPAPPLSRDTLRTFGRCLRLLKKLRSTFPFLAARCFGGLCEARGTDARAVVQGRPVSQAKSLLFHHALVTSIDLCSLIYAKLGCLWILNVVIETVWTFDVKCLRDCWKAKQFVLLEIFTKKLSLVPVKTIFTVCPLTPSAVVVSIMSARSNPSGVNLPTIKHTASVCGVLFAVRTLMLRTVKMHFALGLRFEVFV